MQVCQPLNIVGNICISCQHGQLGYESLLSYHTVKYLTLFIGGRRHCWDDCALLHNKYLTLRTGLYTIIH